MKHAASVVVASAIVFTSWSAADAHCIWRPFELDRVNRQLAGHVVDYTRNHGADRRIWSAALGERRDLYVYLPPCFESTKQYPVILWLHGFAQDEMSFIREVVVPLDRAIQEGKLPPAIVAAPDGSLRGVAGYLSAGSFFLNTPAGRFEDLLIEDVWGFLTSHYPIRPEPEAHALAGVSMGGGAAFHAAIKHPELFKTVAAFYPPVNVRWVDCHCNYMANFDPNCWGWRTDFSRGHEVVGRFYGVFAIRQRQVTFPLYGRRNPDTAALVSRENPIEMLDAYDIRDGQFNFYIGYGGLDQFNIDAQVESFLYHAKERGITVGVGYEPRGKHDLATAMKLMPGLLDWLGPKLQPYAPR